MYEPAGTTSIPRTITLVTKCWEAAESEVRYRWMDMAPTAGEREITQRLWECLNMELKKATTSGALAGAFEADVLAIQPSIMSVSYGALQAACHNLFMQCDLHHEARERITGGDYGTILVRPAVIQTFPGLRFDMKEQGVLCQAKLHAKGRRPRGLTPKQIESLPGHLSFAEIVIYSAMHGHAAPLESFQWLGCRGAEIESVAEWAKGRTLPASRSSTEVLNGLARADVGTSDPDLIKTVLLAGDRPHFTIRIDWPDGQRPPGIPMAVREALLVLSQVRG